MDSSLVSVHHPIQILQWHVQTSEKSCAASGMEMILKAHGLISLEDFSLQDKYGDQNIGFAQREELESRGLTVLTESLPVPELLKHIGREIKHGKFPLISLPVHKEEKKLWFHIFIVQHDGNQIHIIDPATGQSMSGTSEQLATKLGYILRTVELPVDYRIDILTYDRAPQIAAD